MVVITCRLLQQCEYIDYKEVCVVCSSLDEARCVRIYINDDDDGQMVKW